MSSRGRREAARRITAFVLAFVVVASACNSRLLRPPAIVFVDSGERQEGTRVADQDIRFTMVFLAFVPSRVPLHPGDAVNFQVRDTGEPHTIAMGRLVDQALAEVESLGESATIREVEMLPRMRRIPRVFPNVVLGKVPEINRSASERCFRVQGAPALSPTGGAKPCEETEQPDFNGKQSFFSSGIIEEGEPFRVKLADDMAPSSYRFMCLVHRSSMTGVLDVLPKDQERPSVAQLKVEATDEEDQISQALLTTGRNAVLREGGPILAGTGPRGRSRGIASAFFPKDKTTKVGRRVGWTFYRMHSISFRPEREAKEGVLIEEGGRLRLNADAWRPVESRGPPRDAFRFPPPTKAFSIDGGTWDGEGTFSSGIISAIAPATVTYSLRFTKAGEYVYNCLVHPSMRGRIIVE